MEKIKNNINEVALTKALILWNTGVDNEDGGTCHITAELPWKPEWEKFMTWEEANEKFIDEAIGKRDESIFPIELIGEYLTCFVDRVNNRVAMRVNALEKLTEWATKRAKQIITAYDKALEVLNERIVASTEQFYGMIEKADGVDSRGFAKYEELVTIKSYSQHEVITRLFLIANGMGLNNKWTLQSFTSSLSKGCSIQIGEKYHCHLGNKVTNS